MLAGFVSSLSRLVAAGRAGSKIALGINPQQPVHIINWIKQNLLSGGGGGVGMSARESAQSAGASASMMNQLQQSASRSSQPPPRAPTR